MSFPYEIKQQMQSPDYNWYYCELPFNPMANFKNARRTYFDEVYAEANAEKARENLCERIMDLLEKYDALPIYECL